MVTHPSKGPQVGYEPSFTNNRVMDSPPKRAPGVELTMKTLEDEVAALGSVSDSLIARLGGVLNNAPTPCDQSAKIAIERPASCDLDGALHQRIATLMTIRSRLADALSRLEV